VDKLRPEVGYNPLAIRQTLFRLPHVMRQPVADTGISESL